MSDATAGRALPRDEREFRLAMLGLVEGNGHPWSWSAIVNGYEPSAMASCPFPVIPAYLAAEPPSSFGFAGVKVTHVWTDDPAEAPRVAAAARIPEVAARPEDVIGHVDAVMVATDIGGEHVARCRPFVEAGLPVFVDKPLVDSATDLAVFSRWVAAGARVLSSSCLRYAREFLPFRRSTHDLGAVRYASITTPKSWERYGIHALEGIYAILGPGFLSARWAGGPGRSVVHLRHRVGADVIVAAISDMFGSFGCLQLCGTKGNVQATFRDTYYAFRAQLGAFVEYLRTGERPFAFSETEELMRMLIAGIKSRDDGGREVGIEEIVAG
jgi:predicted dehydrogenase